MSELENSVWQKRNIWCQRIEIGYEECGFTCRFHLGPGLGRGCPQRLSRGEACGRVRGCFVSLCFASASASVTGVLGAVCIWVRFVSSICYQEGGTKAPGAGTLPLTLHPIRGSISCTHGTTPRSRHTSPPPPTPDATEPPETQKSTPRQVPPGTPSVPLLLPTHQKDPRFCPFILIFGWTKSKIPSTSGSWGPFHLLRKHQGAWVVESSPALRNHQKILSSGSGG